MRCTRAVVEEVGQLGVLGPKTPTDSRHSCHLLTLWAKQQREDFGLGPDGWKGERQQRNCSRDGGEKPHPQSGGHSRAHGSPWQGLQTPWLLLTLVHTWEPAGRAQLGVAFPFHAPQLGPTPSLLPGTRLAGFGPRQYHFLAVRPWAGDLPSLGLVSSSVKWRQY